MKKPIIFLLIIFMSLFFAVPSSINTFAFAKTKTESEDTLKISAKSCLLLDYNSGTVLYDKNSNERLPIASMTKLATLAIVFDAIEKGAIKETDMVTVSKTASHVGGSSAFLDAGSSYKLNELIKSVIISLLKIFP